MEKTTKTKELTDEEVVDMFGMLNTLLTNLIKENTTKNNIITEGLFMFNLSNDKKRTGV